MPVSGTERSAYRVWRIARCALWLSWLGYALSLFWRPLLWHAQQFRNPGPVYFKAFLLATPTWLLGCGVYLLLRRSNPSWRSWEPPALLLLPVSIAVFYEPRASLTVLAILAAAHGWGALTLKRIGIATRGDAEQLILPGLTGSVAFLVLLFPLGLLGLLRPWLTFMLVAGGLAAGWRAWITLPALLARLRESWAGDHSLTDGLAGLCVPWLLLLSATSTLNALAPSRIWDALRHHLYDALMYAHWEALRPVDGIPYSYFPQGLELLMAATLPFGGLIAAQLIAAVFFPLLVGLVWLIARECGACRRTALIGLALVASVPMVNWTSSVAKNDSALAVCILAGLYAYLRYLGERSSVVLLWGAFLLAAALHVKQTAVFGGIAVTLLFLHAAWSSGQFTRVATRIALIGVLVASAYFLRAAWYTGNPLYPETADDAVSGTIQDYRARLSYGGRLIEAFQVINFDGRQAWEATSPSSNPLGASLVVFSPLLILALPPARRWWAVVMFATVYYMSWVAFFFVVRYLIAPLSVVLALLASQLARLWDESHSAVRFSLAVALVFCLTFGLWGTMLVEVNAPMLAYFTGRVDREGYLSAVTRDFPALAATVKLAGPRDRIHGIANCAGAYVEHPERFSCNPCSTRHCTTITVGEELRRGGFDWLILTKRGQFSGLASPFVRQGRAVQVYEDRDYTVFRWKR